MIRILNKIKVSIVPAVVLAAGIWFYAEGWPKKVVQDDNRPSQVNVVLRATTSAMTDSLNHVTSTVSEPYANPFGSPQQIMQGIYQADHDVLPSTRTIHGLIVPHHMVAAEDIALGIRTLQGQEVKDIVLISPDHYSRCPALFCTTDKGFETYFGQVSPSDEKVQALLSSSLVSNDERLFISEHGIYSILPFIRHYLPDVRVTPLVTSITSNWRLQEDAMTDLLSKVVNDDTVLIISSDFSHYLPLGQAQEMDEQTIDALKSGDLSAIAALKNPAQSDCPACLWSLAQLAQKRGFYHPDVLIHTNSALILKNPDASETTSHYSIVWSE